MLLFGAYRGCGILPGEEMEQIIRTTSVITSILYPERQTNVRECGARVTCIKVIPLVLRILCNFSALPQYLERLARGMRTPCAILLLQICTYCIGVSGFGFVRSTNKKQKRTSKRMCGCTGICSALQGFRRGSGRAMFRTQFAQVISCKISKT